MKHIVKIEDMSVANKFKKFINKYDKTRYISKNTSKNLQKIGIPEIDFKSVENDINECMEFFHYCDTELLKEMIDELSDITGRYLKIDIGKYYSVEQSTYRGNNFNIIYDPDGTSNDIIRNIFNQKIIKNKIHEKEIEDSFKKNNLPGAKGKMSYQHEINKLNHLFKKTTVHPMIYLTFSDIVDYEDDFLYSEDEALKTLKEKKTEIMKIVKRELVEILSFFLKIIGYPTSSIRLNWHFAHFIFMNETCEASITL